MIMTLERAMQIRAAVKNRPAPKKRGRKKKVVPPNPNTFTHSVNYPF